MKPALLTLSFLLLAFPLAFSNHAQPVVDLDGNPVVPGGEYFIKPFFIGPEHPGVVALGKTGNSTCSVTVEVYFQLYGAIPVKFIPAVNPGELFTGTPLRIGFTKEPNCVESSKWAVFLDSDIKQAYVGIGGPEDHPGQQTLYGTFSLSKSTNNDRGYSLVFCSPIIVEDSPLCWNVGYHFLDRTLSLLVLTNNKASFEFGLKKADSFPGIRTVV